MVVPADWEGDVMNHMALDDRWIGLIRLSFLKVVKEGD